VGAVSEHVVANDYNYFKNGAGHY